MNQNRTAIYSELLRSIGNTPLTHLNLPNQSVLYLKEEWKGPTCSHYDRVYIPLLRSLENEGTIIPGKTELIDATTGNAGAALAWAADKLGYQCTIFIPLKCH